MKRLEEKETSAFPAPPNTGPQPYHPGSVATMDRCFALAMHSVQRLGGYYYYYYYYYYYFNFIKEAAGFHLPRMQQYK